MASGNSPSVCWVLTRHVFLLGDCLSGRRSPVFSRCRCPPCHVGDLMAACFSAAICVLAEVDRIAIAEDRGTRKNKDGGKRTPIEDNRQLDARVLLAACRLSGAR